MLDTFRFVPLLASLLTILAFYGLSRAVLRDETAVACAVVAFALLPRSFEWLIMGGGVTRAWGFLFAVLALWQAYRLYTDGDRRAVVLTTLCASATVLSHPEMAWFVAYRPRCCSWPTAARGGAWCARPPSPRARSPSPPPGG